MNFKLVSSFAAAVLAASAASAADVAPVIPTAPPVVVVPPPAVGFDFAGAYAGVTGGGFFDVGPLDFGNVRLGVLVGFNFEAGRLILGVEAGVTWQGAADFDANVQARAGLVIGGRALVYGTAGYMRALTYAASWLTVGGGVEIGVGDRLSIFGEANYLLNEGLTLQAGVKVHFGN